MSLHLELRERIEEAYGDSLDGEVRLTQDALLVLFDGGLAVELRYLDPREYSLQWAWGDAELRIDTAPLHGGLPTYPNHLHDADGRLRADPVTVPGRDPWKNVQALLDRLQEDPLLESTESR